MRTLKFDFCPRSALPTFAVLGIFEGNFKVVVNDLRNHINSAIISLRWRKTALSV